MRRLTRALLIGVTAAALTVPLAPKPAVAVDLCRCVDHDCRAKACLSDLW